MAAVTVVQLPRRTFLQKAEDDLAQCRTEVNSGIHFSKSTRLAMVDLLNRAIIAAREKNHDDELYVTYCDIDALISDWYCESVLKNIIKMTLAEARGGALERQHAESGRLAVENQTLRQANSALEKAQELFERVIEEKSAVLRSVQASLARVEGENKHLREELKKEKASNAQLRDQLAAKGSSPTLSHSTHFREYKETKGKSHHKSHYPSPPRHAYSHR